MTTELTAQGQGNLVGIADPNGVLDAAITASKALARVVSQKKKPVIINGEQYLEFEDWQTLGQFYGVTVKTGDAVLVEIDGVKGAKAHADLISLRTGEIIGGAEAYCMRDEDKWGTRPKYEYHDNERVKVGDEPVPWFQLASMAQTRAGSKSLRNRLAWIAVLAGYRPTPAEEMTGTEVQHDQAGHWCKLHNTAFFMRGKMKSFAHPIQGTEPAEWCHESTEAEVTGKSAEKSPEAKEPAPAKPPETVQEATKSKTTGEKPPDGTMSKIELLAFVQKEKGFRTDKTATEWLTNVCHIEASRITSEPGKVYEEVQELLGK